jgi:hypothetical protein
MHVPFRRGRPSPAMAVAFVALLAALSGTAVALPGQSTVDSGDLKRGAVKSSDIARAAVTGSKIQNGAITGSKLQNGTITGAKIANDTITGAQINDSTLGTIPRAERANTAGTADRANTAGTADRANTAGTAEHANTATTADNANTVGGHAANSLVRVAAAGDDDIALDGVSGTALSTPITAPSAGFLVINAGSDVSNVPPLDLVDCFIEVDGAESLPSARTIELSSENAEENCTTETVVQVTAGDHTVDFEYADVDAGTTVGASSLQVLFVPFGATGALP